MFSGLCRGLFSMEGWRAKDKESFALICGVRFKCILWMPFIECTLSARHNVQSSICHRTDVVDGRTADFVTNVRFCVLLVFLFFFSMTSSYNNGDYEMMKTLPSNPPFGGQNMQQYFALKSRLAAACPSPYQTGVEVVSSSSSSGGPVFGRYGSPSLSSSVCNEQLVASNPNLYVHNVPKDSNEEELRSLFGRYGTVERVRLKVNQKVGPHAVYAFVNFASTAEAQIALNNLQGVDVRK